MKWLRSYSPIALLLFFSGVVFGAGAVNPIGGSGVWIYFIIGAAFALRYLYKKYIKYDSKWVWAVTPFLMGFVFVVSVILGALTS